MSSYTAEGVAPDGTGLAFGGVLPTEPGQYDLVVKAGIDELVRVKDALQIDAYVSAVTPSPVQPGVVTTFTVTGAAIEDTIVVSFGDSGDAQPDFATPPTYSEFTVRKAVYGPGAVDLTLKYGNNNVLCVAPDAIAIDPAGVVEITSVTPATAAVGASSTHTVVGQGLGGYYSHGWALQPAAAPAYREYGSLVSDTEISVGAWFNDPGVYDLYLYTNKNPEDGPPFATKVGAVTVS
jgi:hypothetical protein